VETQASPTEFVTSLLDMLAAHDCLRGGAHFVGHSFGSVVLTWVQQNRHSTTPYLSLGNTITVSL
jgi:hypothetical protein